MGDKAFVEKVEEQAKLARSMPEAFSSEEVQGLGISLMEMTHRLQEEKASKADSMIRLEKKTVGLEVELSVLRRMNVFQTILVTFIICVCIGVMGVFVTSLILNKSQRGAQTEYDVLVEQGEQQEKRIAAEERTHERAVKKVEAARKQRLEGEARAKVTAEEAAAAALAQRKVEALEQDGARVAACKLLEDEVLQVEAFAKRLKGHTRSACGFEEESVTKASAPPSSKPPAKE